ncbi:MAG: hypothetical protein HZC54_00820 [Verrucomicrobia bacterium]|nr:hypothetical protein [Verrucomicrobiota bacterium]
MNLELDLTWRLPLRRRWDYVRRRKPTAFPLPWWVLMLLGGPVPVIVALVIVRVALELLVVSGQWSVVSGQPWPLELQVAGVVAAGLAVWGLCVWGERMLRR